MGETLHARGVCQRLLVQQCDACCCGCCGRSVLDLEEESQPGVLFIVNGVLSTVSDNVFVATVFIKGVAK